MSTKPFPRPYKSPCISLVSVVCCNWQTNYQNPSPWPRAPPGTNFLPWLGTEHDGARRPLRGAAVVLRGPGALDGGAGGPCGRRPRRWEPDLSLITNTAWKYSPYKIACAVNTGLSKIPFTRFWDFCPCDCLFLKLELNLHELACSFLTTWEW